ncbi:MAG TPA: PEP-CTERM sorting domain-containing protein [Verrucomicrobiota bacterium]|nr:PEP-CTERM sorting domain-containing protein [Verrucomicrobiota bacterium]
MKRTLFALAMVIAAGTAMAADGGLLTFNTYYSASNNLKVVSPDGQEISTANGWYLTLLNSSGTQVMGTKGGALGALVPIVINFTGTTGFAAAGGDWSLAGFDQGSKYNFYVAAYKGADYATAIWPKGNIGPFEATLGGNQLSPPVPAGRLDYGGTPVLIFVPEPSVLSLSVFGMAVLAIRRRRQGM